MIKIKDLEGQGQMYPFIIDQLTVSNYFYIVQSMMEAIRKAWDSGEQVKLELGEISYKNGRILFANLK